ncbi:poly polymerase and DNA-ligase Zn-finger region-domain-containing protein [Thermothelomyces heterothallicus CBS 202.75]|uniref:poly polymerase and DNA-ligase Zn-finger region-domain-containing protein n=1 Tax=Thermothelomyces heterothallicus CBS 202.75 TaxID=1149848 RepID=UPI0037436EF4
MSYRIEISPSGRAGCQVSACKKEGKKIAKGELRLGSWVEYREQDRGGWQWRHWGCVSGEQVVNIQQKIGKDSNGEYRWDAIDGWEDLEDRPDIREKIKRVIRQGHIDPEDFNGKKAKTEPEAEPASGEEVKDGNKDEAEREKEGAKKSKKAGSKSHRGKTEVEDEEADEPEPKKPRKATGKRGREEKHEPDEKADEPAPPVKKAKRASKKDSVPEPAPKPEKSKKAGKGKGGARGSAAIKEESESELPPEPTPETPKKGGRGKRAAKVSVKEESNGVSEAEPEPEPEPAKKKASRSKKVKKGASASPEPDTKSGAGAVSTSAPKSGTASKPGKEEEERGEENTAPKTKKGRKGSEKSVPMSKGRARKAAA